MCWHRAGADAVGMTTTALPPSYPSPTRVDWGWGVWFLVVVAVIVEASAAVAAVLFINWGASTTCGDPATWSNVREGEIGLIVSATVGLVPWATAMLASTRRLRLGVAAGLAVSPLLFGMVAGLDPQFWTNGWCF
jgi:hypothetical protein